MINKLKTIVAWLKADVAINAILWSRIYIGSPQEDTQSGIYLNLNIISEIQNIDVNVRNRVEFRFIGKDSDTNIDELNQIEILVKDYLYNNLEQLWFFKLNNANFYNWYDNLKRPVLIRDYIFYYT